jgi:hypothetical protein
MDSEKAFISINIVLTLSIISFDACLMLDSFKNRKKSIMKEKYLKQWLDSAFYLLYLYFTVSKDIYELNQNWNWMQIQLLTFMYRLHTLFFPVFEKVFDVVLYSASFFFYISIFQSYVCNIQTLDIFCIPLSILILYNCWRLHDTIVSYFPNEIDLCLLHCNSVSEFSSTSEK